MAISKDAILGTADVAVETVDVPEWGGQVCIRTMTGIERDDFENRLEQSKGQNWRAKLLVKCISDEQGNRLFSDEDAGKLGAKSAPIIHKLFRVAQKVNKLGREEVEEYEKNSAADPNGDSISG